MIVKGWRVLFHPVFARRFRALRLEAERLQRELPPDRYRSHPTVRLLAGVDRLIRELVPEDPNGADYQLRLDLVKFRRAKGQGLPPRYRLIWVFSTQAKAIIFLYLNDEETLRKAGLTSDPYEVFKKLLRQGKIGDDFEANRRMIDEASSEQNPPSQALDQPIGEV